MILCIMMQIWFLHLYLRLLFLALTGRLAVHVFKAFLPLFLLWKTGLLLHAHKPVQKLVLNKDGIELDNGSGATIKLANNKVAINGDALEVQ